MRHDQSNLVLVTIAFLLVIAPIVLVGLGFRLVQLDISSVVECAWSIYESNSLVTTATNLRGCLSEFKPERITHWTLYLLSLTLVWPLFMLVYPIQWNRLPISPIKAIASSLAFVVFMGAIRLDAAGAFFTAIAVDGLDAAGFIAFNVFADSFSLLETRWILQNATDTKNTGLVGFLALLNLLVIDILFSALIFLILPTNLGVLPTLTTIWETMRFQGPIPYLGILLWTTFSTSVLFYLFVAAVFALVLPWTGFNKVFRLAVSPWDIERQTFWCVGMAVCMLTFGGIMIAALVSTFL
jgi:hypothetical protein